MIAEERRRLLIPACRGGIQRPIRVHKHWAMRAQDGFDSSENVIEWVSCVVVLMFGGESVGPVERAEGVNCDEAEFIIGGMRGCGHGQMEDRDGELGG